MSREEQNLAKLRKLLAEHDDPRDAFREYTGDTLTAMAERVGMRRTDMTFMLRASSPRRYLPERRVFEVEYHLPAYNLDDLLDPIITASQGGENGE